MSIPGAAILEKLNENIDWDLLSKINISNETKSIHGLLNLETRDFLDRKLTDFRAYKKSLETLAEKFGCDFLAPESCKVQDCQFLLFNYALIQFHITAYSSSYRILSFLRQHDIDMQLKFNCYALSGECLLKMNRGEECMQVIDCYFSETSQGRSIEEGEVSFSKLEIQLRIQKLKACLMEKNLNEAEKIMKELLDAEADGTLLSHLISNVEYVQNNFDVSLSLLGQVSNVPSNYSKTGTSYTAIYLNNLGCLFYNLGKINLAALHFQKALIENQSLLKALPDGEAENRLVNIPLPLISANLYFEIVYNLGVSLLHCGKAKEAFACFYDCRVKYKDDPQLWLRLAESCIQFLKPENKEDFQLNEKRKNLVKGVIGTGSLRRLILNSKISSITKNMEKVVHGMDTGNALRYINKSIQLCDDFCKNSIEKESKFRARPGYPTEKAEVSKIRTSAIVAGAFLSLTGGDFDITLKFCNDFLEEYSSPAQSYLIKLYRAEALVMLSRPDEALPLLNPQNLTSIDSRTDSSSKKPMFVRAWYPSSLDVAKCVLQYNMAVALTIRGELEKSAEIIRLLWMARGNGADIPTQVVALALYIEIKRGNFEIARNIVKYQFPSFK